MRFEEHMKIPGSTKQQRKIAGKKSYPTTGLRVARATWQAIMERHTPLVPFVGPVMVYLEFCYHKNGGKDDFKTTRPDVDNLAKIVIDAMIAADFFFDDAQVAVLTVGKYWTPGPEKIMVEVVSLHHIEKEQAE